MRIDLHIHTCPRSPCSAIDPADLLKEAKRAGLDALCITEHQNPWGDGELSALAKESGIRIFQGNEITTNQGDVLVFGYHEDLRGVVPIQDLHKAVTAAGGLMIAAHPFRGFLLFGITQLRMDAYQASQRAIFQYVNGVEIFNCKLTDAENQMARQVAEHLGLLGVAGSDAHRLDEVGRCVTILEREIKSEPELITELRAGRFTPEFRKS